MRQLILGLGAAALLVLPAIARPVAAAPAQLDQFFAAAALPRSAFPRGMVDAGSGPLGQDDLANVAGTGAADELAADGFLGAYDQTARTTNLAAALTGQPAGAGDVIAVFDSPADAAAWYTFETANAVSFGMGFASSAGISFEESGQSQPALTLGGDQSTALELQGTASVSGLTLPVSVDIGIMQRGATVSTVVVVAVRDQAGVLQTISQALDASVSAALPLLAQ